MGRARKSMAFLAALFKHGLAGLVLLLAAAGWANAATFSAQRGLNLDIWVSWPDESRWDEEDVLLPFPEWRRTVDQAALKRLREAGFDFVRMPVDPSPFLSDKAARFHDRLYGEVSDAVRAITAAGLKVVVDMHLFPAGGNRAIGMSQVMDDAALFERYVETVRRMARTLAREDPAMVAFELMNEPIVDCAPGTTAWPDRLGRLFAAARASATRLTLVLSGGCWGSADGLAALDPTTIPDDNVLWSFHSYAPFLLTHQGAGWAGDFIRYVAGLPYPPHAVPRAELDAALERIRERIRADAPWTRRAGMLAYLDEEIAKLDTADELAAVMAAPFVEVAGWARRHDIAPQRILLGEFGMIRQEYGTQAVMPAEWRAAYVADMIDLAERNGFAWSIWGYGGAFGVVEAFEGEPTEGAILRTVEGLPRR